LSTNDGRTRFKGHGGEKTFISDAIPVWAL